MDANDDRVDEGMATAASESAQIDQEQYAAQQAAIAAEQSTHALIGPVASLQSLAAEYESNPRFLTKIRAAADTPFSSFRRVRGDGNCFYRAYVFAVLDWISQTKRNPQASEQEKQQAQDVLKTVEGSLAGLLAQGYEAFTMEDFHETFNEQFTWVDESQPSADELAERFRDDGLGMYLVSFARYLTSGFLASHAAEYAPFIPDGRSVEEFRRTEIEPMGREVEQLQIVCLSTLLQVGVRIAYLDQSAEADSAKTEEMRSYVFPDGAEPRVHLLYRPGHYDVLVRSQS